MRLLTILLVTIVGMAAASAQTAGDPLDPSVAGTYTGTYQWLDFAADSIGDKDMTMVLTRTEAGYDVTFKANFQTEQFGKVFKEAKQYDYSGSLALHESKGYVTGLVYQPDKKRFWVIDLKVKKDRILGMAKETEGLKTWGVFSVTKTK